MLRYNRILQDFNGKVNTKNRPTSIYQPAGLFSLSFFLSAFF